MISSLVLVDPVALQLPPNGKDELWVGGSEVYTVLNPWWIAHLLRASGNPSTSPASPLTFVFECVFKEESRIHALDRPKEKRWCALVDAGGEAVTSPRRSGPSRCRAVRRFPRVSRRATVRSE